MVLVRCAVLSVVSMFAIISLCEREREREIERERRRERRREMDHFV